VADLEAPVWDLAKLEATLAARAVYIASVAPPTDFVMRHPLFKILDPQLDQRTDRVNK